ncbi:hypothetical protein BOX15_Mlig005929g1 [Macrostomum lignano]|uniref:Uncharacterized protein n=1 Tax=Macrostomum lignano TaxID=282301 RepID=A0A267G246_9PLAT|nr:hypothetical protein BOX15_Mlig005929g1 [Macrostomum lignano]
MLTAEQLELQEALDAQDGRRLMRLCRRLTRNLVVTAGGYEMTLAHHVAIGELSNGLECLKTIVNQAGAECLSDRNQNGNTPVHLAAMFQDDTWMIYLHKTLGSDCFEVGGKHNRTAAHFGALNLRGNSALKWLARNLGQRCLRGLDEEGNTPLHLAAWRQGADSMQLFKNELGTFCFQQQGRFKRTPVHQAATNRTSKEALRWLINECGSEALKVTDEHGNTAVHLASCKQDEDSLKLIKDCLGCLVFMVRGRHGFTTVHYAAMNVNGDASLLWFVKELGSSCLLEKGTALDQTPLHLAAQHQGERPIDVARRSLGLSCVMQADRRRRTVVHYAAMNRRSTAALRQIVAQLGPECLKQKDADGSMCLHLAAQYQGLESMALIWDCLGATAFKLEGQNSRTMVHYAAENDQKKELISWIVRKLGHQCLLISDSEGVTPARISGYYEYH